MNTQTLAPRAFTGSDALLKMADDIFREVYYEMYPHALGAPRSKPVVKSEPKPYVHRLSQAAIDLLHLIESGVAVYGNSPADAYYWGDFCERANERYFGRHFMKQVVPASKDAIMELQRAKMIRHTERRFVLWKQRDYEAIESQPRIESVGPVLALVAVPPCEPPISIITITPAQVLPVERTSTPKHETVRRQQLAEFLEAYGEALETIDELGASFVGANRFVAKYAR